jgi:predicted nuclease with TOPRIM domain
MIIRQGDQIQFLLTRIIELDKKIKNLKTEITIEEDVIQEDQCLQDEDQCLQEEDQCLQEEDECLQEEDECLQDETQCLEKDQSQCLEKDFELIESTSTFKISKNNGWLRFIF